MTNYFDAEAQKIADKWVKRLGRGFYPDTRGLQYLNPILSEGEAAAYDADMARLHEIALSPYQEAFAAMERAGLIVESYIMQPANPPQEGAPPPLATDARVFEGELSSLVSTHGLSAVLNALFAVAEGYVEHCYRAKNERGLKAWGEAAVRLSNLYNFTMDKLEPAGQL